MKIYITRNSAFSLQCGGLSRVNVWFQKPHYYYKYLGPDHAFGPDDGQLGVVKAGWMTGGGEFQSSVPFSTIFGYGDDNEGEGRQKIALFVWSKVKEHFHNAPFSDWDKLEDEKKVDQRQFLLELEVDMNML